MNSWESVWMKYKTCCIWHCTLSSVNTVTSIALHGPLHQCVSAIEDGYHNRNLIQLFYSQGETRCIPSNNRHCLNIHVLLGNKSDTLPHHMCGFSHPHILQDLDDILWCTCTLLCLCEFTLLSYFFVRHNPNCWTELPLSLLICQARDSKRTTPPFWKWWGV